MNTLITESLKASDVSLLFGFPRKLMSRREVKMVEWVVNYTIQYDKPPTLMRFCLEFVHFIPEESADPLGDIYDQELSHKRNLYVREQLVEMQDFLLEGHDPLAKISALHADIVGGRSDITKYTTYDRTSYFRQPDAFPYEIPVIDKYTGGISKGDLIYLIGRLGTGKTTFALWLLTKSLQAGRRILVVSNENRAEDVVAKIDSYMGGFNPLKKRLADWSSFELNRLRTVSFIAKNLEGEVFIPNRPVSDVKEIQSLVYTYKPDLLMVDGIYLMGGASGESHWEKITSISRSLKQLAEGEGTPILGIHQASRSAIGRRIEIEHIAYADALAQDADLVLTINKEEDESLFVESIKNRWGQDRWGFFMRFYFETMSVKILNAKLVGSDTL